MEPFKAKVVRPIPVVPREVRAAALADAGWNPSLVPADKVPYDFLSDSGTGALSDRQVAALMTGDEAYAGSRDFGTLKAAVTSLFGFDRLLPVHQGRGAENLLCRALLAPGAIVASNAPFETTVAHVGNQKARAVDVIGTEEPPFSGNVDIAALEACDRPAMVVVGMTCNAMGGRPVSLANLARVRGYCDRAGVPLVVDGSRLFENAWFVAEAEADWQGRPVADIVRTIADMADVLYMSGKKDALNKIGGFVAVRDEKLFRTLVDLGLIFEGMPSYGGMAGREMAALAAGLGEAADDRYLTHRVAQIRSMADRLRAAGVPFLDPPGGHCLVLDAVRFVPASGIPGCALNAALYDVAGIRGAALAGKTGALEGGPSGLFHEKAGATVNLVRLAIPRRTFTDAQLAHVADLVAHVWAHRDKIADLVVADSPPGRAKFASRFALAASAAPMPSVTIATDSAPFVRAVVEPFDLVGPEGRRAPLERAGFSMFSLDSAEVAIDLFTDSGTSAMSAAQWARQWQADDVSIGSCSHARFQEAVRQTYGFPHALATHQGRGAEAVLFEALGAAAGRAVVTNMQFFSTAQHIRRVGADLVDVIRDEAYDLSADAAFKGDVDLEKLRRALSDRDVAVVALSLTVNDAGGQPMSRANLAAAADLCRDAGVPLWLDATRLAENAWFVREAEQSAGSPRGSLAGHVRDLAGLATGMWVSAKKDCLVNIGGFIAFRDEALRLKLLDTLILYEGMPGSGGLAGRDLEFMAVGMAEMVDEAYMAHRVGQVRRLWQKLDAAGIPVLRPPGGHAVMVDSEAFLPHVAPDQFPGHVLANALYLESGVRAMPVWTHLRPGVSPKAAKREMLRLTIPRRVYSEAQLDYVAKALIRLHARREALSGLTMTDGDGMFPFITGRFAQVKVAQVR
jgi:tyrosine phenol-lyase